MIARAASSTSAAASRLVERKTRKRSAKSGARLSRRIGMALSRRTPGPGPPLNGAGADGSSTRPAAVFRFPGNGRGHVVGMDRAFTRRPALAEVTQLHFQALDFEPQRAATGEGEGDDPGRG